MYVDSHMLQNNRINVLLYHPEKGEIQQRCLQAMYTLILK